MATKPKKVSDKALERRSRAADKAESNATKRFMSLPSGTAKSKAAHKQHVKTEAARASAASKTPKGRAQKASGGMTRGELAARKGK